MPKVSRKDINSAWKKYRTHIVVIYKATHEPDFGRFIGFDKQDFRLAILSTEPKLVVSYLGTARINILLTADPRNYYTLFKAAAAKYDNIHIL